MEGDRVKIPQSSQQQDQAVRPAPQAYTFKKSHQQGGDIITNRSTPACSLVSTFLQCVCYEHWVFKVIRLVGNC